MGNAKKVKLDSKNLSDRHHSIIKTHPIALLTPLLLAFFWMGTLILNGNIGNAPPNENIVGFGYVSQINLTDQINSLFAFIIIYGLFLLYLFWYAKKWVLKPTREKS